MPQTPKPRYSHFHFEPAIEEIGDIALENIGLTKADVEEEDEDE